MGGKVREAEPVGRYSTYRIGGPATVLLPAGPEDVGAALTLAGEAGVPWFAIGLGSNILLPDEGLDALVIRLGKGLDRLERNGDDWTVGAGLPAPLAARRTAEAGFAGLHIFVGVPGTVGGGVYMNAGCHGGDWSEIVERVTVVDAAGKDTGARASAISRSPTGAAGSKGGSCWRRRCGCGQQESGAAGRGDRRDVRVASAGHAVQPAVLRQRIQESGRSRAGSRRTEPAPRASSSRLPGSRDSPIGGAQVSPMHANYFVNTGSATAADVKKLIEHVQRAVEERFGVRLEPEVKLIGSRGEYLNSER